MHWDAIKLALHLACAQACATLRFQQYTVGYVAKVRPVPFEGARPVSVYISVQSANAIVVGAIVKYLLVWLHVHVCCSREAS